MGKKFLAEFFGTMWLVIGGCGTAILATNTSLFPGLNVNFIGVALAFGLTVLTMAYTIGHISGCHLNPAVTIGLWVGKRLPQNQVFTYIAAQVLGAILGASIIYFIASGQPNFTAGDFAANGYGDHSPGNFNLTSAFITEFVMTFFFLLVILGVTSPKAPAGFAGIAIGLCLTLIHLISIPVTNTSVNPARSTSQAFFADGGWAFGQLWLFWVAPILGAVIAGLLANYFAKED